MLIQTCYRYGALFPPPAPSQIKAPLQVRSCGHYITEAGFRDTYMRKDFLQLFWGVRGRGCFVHGKEVFHVGARDVFFFLPGDWHDITVQNAPFEYYWITFDGENLDHLIRQFDIRRKVYEADVCPVGEFGIVEENLLNFSAQGEYLAGAAAYRILSLAFAGRMQEKELFSKFREQIQLYFSDPALTVELIAGRLNVHRTTLARVVTAACGISPSEYLLSFRLQEAQNRLRGTDSSIKMIALETGFRDPNYFAKVFRRKFSVSPNQARKIVLNLNAETSD